MKRKRKFLKLVLVISCILLFLIGLLAGRYLLPSCPVCPDCPDCPDCPECPECPSCPLPPTISIEKWIRKGDCCCWQKEISAEKGEWVQVKIVVSVTGTMNNVWVRDATVACDPWERVQDLKVNGVSFSGDIAKGIFLGKLKDEFREITFRAQLSTSTHKYNCGVNTLLNLAEAGDCGFQATAVTVTRINIINIKCVAPAPSCSEPKEPRPCPDCPPPIPPPPPPGPEGPAERPA